MFERDEVIQAFQALPKSVKIIVCYERNELDPQSKRFIEFLDKRRETLVTHIGENSRHVPHGMAIDDLHCKMEEDVPDDTEVKHVEYFVFDRPRARAYRIDIDRLIKNSKLIAR